MRALVAMLAALTVAGCFLDDVDLTGKRCPCVEGYVCDQSRGVCVLPGASARGGGGGATATGGGGATSSTASSGGAGGMEDPAAIQPSNLRADWTTPNVILWRWDRSDADVPDQLAGYELVVGTSEQDVRGRTGSARVFDAEENPELGRYFLPHTGGDDPVEMTMTDGHDPDTTYYAQLLATDTASRTAVTNVAQARTTLDYLEEVVVFSEADMAGYSIPSGFQRTSGNAHEGTYCYEWVNDKCAEGEKCFENLRRQGLSVDLSAIGQGAFSTTAYVEVAVSNGSSVPGFWSELWLKFPDGVFARFQMWTIRTGDYRVYQFPLRALEVDGEPLEHAQLASPLNGFNVGSSWEGTAPIRVDELRIRW